MNMIFHTPTLTILVRPLLSNNMVVNVIPIVKDRVPKRPLGMFNDFTKVDHFRPNAFLT